MAIKWHPASGKFGWLGETAGSKTARESRTEIDKMLASLEGRRGGIGEYYGAVGELEGKKERMNYLTGIEKFIGESYDVRSESEKRMEKTNLVNVYDESAERSKDKIARDREMFMDQSQYSSDIRRLNLGQKERADVYGLEDLIRQLGLERQQYA